MGRYIPAREQAIVRLRVVGGHSSAEVAALLGYRSADVIDVTMSRLRKKLAEGPPPSLMGPILGR